MLFVDELKVLMEKDKGIKIAVLAFAIIAPITLFIYGYSDSGSYKVLFKELSDEEVYKISSLLDEKNIGYVIDLDSAGISVKDEDVYKSRMLVMQSNYIGGSNVGFEIFDESEFGMTEFSQKVNYQRALQGELSRTISSLSEIDFARLHIVQPATSIFEDKGQKPRASVTVFVKSGMLLTKKQIEGIQRIVASSVDKMDVKDVVVSDQGGNVLTGHKTEMIEEQEEKLHKKINVEKYYSDKVKELIGAYIKDGAYSVSVNVNLDFNKVKKSKEAYLKDNLLIANERVTSGKDGKIQAKDVEYKYGKEVVTEEPEYGAINNIQVAVLISNDVAHDVIDALSEALHRAIGFNKNRGDAVSIRSVEIAASLIAVSDRPDSVINEIIQKDMDVMEPVKIGSHEDLPVLFKWIPFTVEQLLTGMFVVIVLLLSGFVYLVFNTHKNPILTKQERDQFVQEINSLLLSDKNG